MKNLYDEFVIQAEKTPENVALSDLKSEITFKELKSRVDFLSEYLHELFFLHESNIESFPVCAIWQDNKIDMVVSCLTIMKLNAICMPIDSFLPENKVSSMFQTSKAQYLIIDKSISDHNTWLKKKFKGQTIYPEVISYQRDPAKFFSKKIFSKNKIAYLMFTSGSSGNPKAVMVPHAGLRQTLISIQRFTNFCSDDVFLSLNTFVFDIHILEVFLPLITGGKCIFAYNEFLHANLEKMLNLLKLIQPTYIQLTASILNQLMGQLDLKIFHDLVSQCNLICGGEQVTPELAETCLSLFKRVYHAYGPTEASIWVAFDRIISANDIFIKNVVENNKIYVLNSDFEPVGHLQEGELYISGIGLFSGYLNDPEKTEMNLIDNIFYDERHDQKFYQKMYRTGDRFRKLDNEKYQFIGRSDRQVKISGELLVLNELEVMLNKLEQVENSAVILTTDKNNLYIFYSCSKKYSSVDTDSSHIETFLQKEFSFYCPYTLVQLDDMPLTISNKINYGELQKIAAKHEDLNSEKNFDPTLPLWEQ